MHYIAKGEEEELIRIAPTPNSLAVLFRVVIIILVFLKFEKNEGSEVMRFRSYVTQSAPSPMSAHYLPPIFKTLF